MVVQVHREPKEKKVGHHDLDHLVQEEILDSLENLEVPGVMVSCVLLSSRFLAAVANPLEAQACPCFDSRHTSELIS